MGMLLGPVLLLELRVCIKSHLSLGVVGVMKNNSALGFLRLSEKFLFLVVCVLGVLCLLM